MNYFDHNDKAGQTQRIRVQNAQAERARMLGTFEESCNGDVTLYMSALELSVRGTEALVEHCMGFRNPGFQYVSREVLEQSARIFRMPKG